MFSDKVINSLITSYVIPNSLALRAPQTRPKVIFFSEQVCFSDKTIHFGLSEHRPDYWIVWTKTTKKKKHKQHNNTIAFLTSEKNTWKVIRFMISVSRRKTITVTWHYLWLPKDRLASTIKLSQSWANMANGRFHTICAFWTQSKDRHGWAWTWHSWVGS